MPGHLENFRRRIPAAFMRASRRHLNEVLNLVGELVLDAVEGFQELAGVVLN
jgi:hypothetical protein